MDNLEFYKFLNSIVRLLIHTLLPKQSKQCGYLLTRSRVVLSVNKREQSCSKKLYFAVFYSFTTKKNKQIKQLKQMISRNQNIKTPNTKIRAHVILDVSDVSKIKE